MQPTLIKGGIHTDLRGTIRFVNRFMMNEVKRFYLIQHKDTTTIRAWQGHKVDQKWFYVVEGAFKIVVVKPDTWEQSAKISTLTEFELYADNNEVLHIPAGFANGFKALKPESKMMVFTDCDINDAAKDDFRFPSDFWYDWHSPTLKT